MLQTSKVIQNIKEWGENETWTSPDGGGTTRLDAVYTAPIYMQKQGKPFAVVYDEVSGGVSGSNQSVDFNTTIVLEICVSVPEIDKDTKIEKREEAMLRLREAWDHFKTEIVKYSVMNEWTENASEGHIHSFSFQNVTDNQLNLEKRVVRMMLMESVKRI